MGIYLVLATCEHRFVDKCLLSLFISYLLNAYHVLGPSNISHEQNRHSPELTVNVSVVQGATHNIPLIERDS